MLSRGVFKEKEKGGKRRKKEKVRKEKRKVKDKVKEKNGREDPKGKDKRRPKRDHENIILLISTKEIGLFTWELTVQAQQSQIMQICKAQVCVYKESPVKSSMSVLVCSKYSSVPVLWTFHYLG